MHYISDLDFKNNIVPHQFNLLYAGCGTGKTEWATRKVFRDFPNIKPCETLLIVPKTWIAKQQAEKKNVYRYVGSEKEMSEENKRWRDYWNGISDEVDNENVVNVLTYATLIKILRSPESGGHIPFERIKLVIIDECHSLFTETYMSDLNIINLWLNIAMKTTDTLFVGMTATPAVIRRYAKKSLCSPVNQINKGVIMNYTAENLIITDKEAIPYMLNSGYLKGRTLIMCNSVQECKCLSYVISNSAYIVSEYNEEYTSEMAQIVECILEKNTIPDTFKGNELKVLLSTSVIKEGITLKKISGIENIICMSGCDVNIIQVLGRCRYNVKNLIISRTPYTSATIISYVRERENQFAEFCKTKYTDNGWFESIRDVLSFNDIRKIQYKTKDDYFCSEVYNIPKRTENRISKALTEKLNMYLKKNWLKKFISEEERKTIVQFMHENAMISDVESKISPRSFYRFIEDNSDYTLEITRKRIKGKRESGCYIRRKRK